MDFDNLACILLLGAIALTSIIVPITNVTLASSIASGLIGYLAKGVIKK